MSMLSLGAYAQSDMYQSNSTLLSTIKVMANGVEKTNAWAGGQNAPQFAVADMNKDGKDDLIVFENNDAVKIDGVKVYIRVDAAGSSLPRYRFSPEYHYKFPEVKSYMKLIDYNCDNIPDLFHMGANFQGLVIADGYYDDSDILSFKPEREIRFYRQGSATSSPINIRPSDIPSLEDIDHDGDLDFVTYGINGYYISAWKNTTKEDNLPCDSFRLVPWTSCWGKVMQDYPRAHFLGTTYCPPFRDDPQGMPNHGNNAMCLIDIDGDSDFDFLDGNQDYSDIQLVINGKADIGYPIDSMIAQDTLWQKNGHQLYMPKFPAAYWVDIDGDGDRDILISPKLAGTENYKCIALYENQGSATAPNYVYQSDTFMIETMIDAGTNSYPVVYDYNRDGLPDLFIGTLGRHNPVNGTNLSRIVYYQNTGTATMPIFTLKDNNFLNLESLELSGGAITIGDLDNDGKDELLIGRANGNIAYFKNNAANGAAQPDWQLWLRELLDRKGKVIRANNNATPFIYDVDKDGKNDLVSGMRLGYIYYYHNFATNTGDYQLEKAADSLGKLKVGVYQGEGSTTPFIGKVDNSGKTYLMLGTKDGTIQQWEGIDSGDPNKTYTQVEEKYSNIQIKGSNSAPYFADINNDGKYEVFIGNDLGGVTMYFQIFNVNVDDVAKKQNQLTVYPNPAMDILNIGLNDKVIPAKSTVKIYSNMGQLLSNVPMQYRDNAWRVDISALPAGMYLCSVYYDGAVHTARFSKTK